MCVLHCLYSSQLKITCQHTGVMVRVRLCFHLSADPPPVMYSAYLCCNLSTDCNSVTRFFAWRPKYIRKMCLFPSVYQISIVSNFRENLLLLVITILKDEPLVTVRWLRNYDRIWMLLCVLTSDVELPVTQHRLSSGQDNGNRVL